MGLDQMFDDCEAEPAVSGVEQQVRNRRCSMGIARISGGMISKQGATFSLSCRGMSPFRQGA